MRKRNTTTLSAATGRQAIALRRAQAMSGIGGGRDYLSPAISIVAMENTLLADPSRFDPDGSGSDGDITIIEGIPDNPKLAKPNTSCDWDTYAEEDM